ncbi:hypothetical protein PE067_14065 [Paracoccus sp. DMF-8]|uniref:hypothetical protein n=1 Tax=Paracoccus sp. DMF-8 TaxID=3019445 RepID=UPI0023E838AD|nr:hypothetical protein [Paracoccus sp. DMF-8]MDF3607161.1 hypothetical protein [Paracoccus sp. DMF-8]
MRAMATSISVKSPDVGPAVFAGLEFLVHRGVIGVFPTRPRHPGAAAAGPVITVVASCQACATSRPGWAGIAGQVVACPTAPPSSMPPQKASESSITTIFWVMAGPDRVTPVKGQMHLIGRQELDLQGGHHVMLFQQIDAQFFVLID